MDLSQLHIDRPLTDVSVMYNNPAFISPQIFIPFPVNDPSDEFFIYSKDNLRVQNDSVAPHALSNQSEFYRTLGRYKCTGHGLQYPMADEEVKADDLNSLAIDITILLTDQIQLNREMALVNSLITNMTPVDLSAAYISGAAVVSGGTGYAVGNTITLPGGGVLTVLTVAAGVIQTVSITTPGTYTQSTIPTNPVAQSATSGGGAGATFNLTFPSNNQFDNANFDPVHYLDLQKEVVGKATGKKPNVLALSRPVFRGLRNNPNVKSRISGAPNIESSLITAAQLAAVLEVDQVLVGDAILDTAPEGLADSLNYVWGNNALLFYRPPSPGLRTVALGYEFLWNWAPGIRGGAGVGVRQFREERKRQTVVECLRYYDLTIIDPKAGVLFTNSVSA